MLCALLLIGAKTPCVQAAVDLLDVAFVAVPAIMGALAGRESVKQAIQQERKELEQAQGKYQKKSADLTHSQQEVVLSQLILKSTKSSDDASAEEIACLHTLMDDIDQSIHKTKQAIEETRDWKNRLESAKNKLEQKGISPKLLHEGKQRLYEWEQDIKWYEKQLRNEQDWKRVFGIAKNRQEASLADTELVNQMTQDIGKEEKEINQKLDKVGQKLQGVTQDLKEIASDEPKQLLKGILVGGAVGAGLGLIAREFVKYEVGLRQEKKNRGVGAWKGVGHSQAVAALNLPRSTTFDEVKKQYRILAVREHPDKHSNSPESAAKFCAINEAYGFLVDFFKFEKSNTARRQDRPYSQISSLPLLIK